MMSMGDYVANELIEAMSNEMICSENASVLNYGINIQRKLPRYKKYKSNRYNLNIAANGCSVDTFDPWVSSHTAQKTFGTNHLSKNK